MTNLKKIQNPESSLFEVVDPEYHALKVLSSAEDRVNQRSISRELGMSLGMTNTILRNLAKKGLLVMRRINGRNLAYALTPEGTRELARRALRYLKRTLGSVERWKDQLDSILSEVKLAGFRMVRVSGPTDFAFILEHLCRLKGLGLEMGDFTSPGEDTDALAPAGSAPVFIVVTENSAGHRRGHTMHPEKTAAAGILYLQDLL